jgi:hypothetical protein
MVNNYYDKYKKYKNKYLKLKTGGNNLNYLTLYHGSPFKLKYLEPKTPRGDNPFNTQTGIYLTSNEMEAKLYSIARDKERKNKGWSIRNNNLYLVEELWNEEIWKITVKDLGKPLYELNEIGYLHIINTNNYEQNPNNLSEYIVKEPICIDDNNIIEIRQDDIKDNIIYVSSIKFKNNEF